MGNSEIMKDKQIGIIGSYPLPYGGVAIHIERFCKLLDQSHYTYSVYDIRSKEAASFNNVYRLKKPYFWYLKYILFSREKIIHLHTTHPLFWFLFGISVLKRTHFITTIHSVKCPNYFSQANWFIKKLMTEIINRSYLVITVNDEFRDSFLSSLVPVGLNPKKIKTIHPFIPPTLTDADYQDMDERVQSFIDTHSPIISVNAFRLTFYNDHDLYGIDMCIELCAYLKNEYPDVGLIVCISVMDTPEYFCTLQENIRELDIESNILILTDGVSFPPILSLSDIFVRPTNTDGDALSIREALSFGIPAITSDVVVRPEGCVTFKTRDQADFNQKVLDTLHHHNEISQNIKKNITSESSELLDIYKEILGH